MQQGTRRPLSALPFHSRWPRSCPPSTGIWPWFCGPSDEVSRKRLTACRTGLPAQVHGEQPYGERQQDRQQRGDCLFHLSVDEQDSKDNATCERRQNIELPRLEHQWLPAHQHVAKQASAA